MNAATINGNEEVVLALPWERLVAAATDAAILLASHCLCFLFFLVDNALPDTSLLVIASTVFGWLYLWISWSGWGATPGQMLWRIRIVSSDGERFSPSRAALRCIGYALATLPLKGGFLPILWHPRRQGWHDQIAHTIVVKWPQPATINKSLSTRKSNPRIFSSDWPPPDFRAPRRGWYWVLLAYMLLAIAMTYPLLLHFTTHRAGISGDGDVFLWDYWYFSHALQTGQSLLQTNLLFYPQTISLSFNTMNWLGCVVAYPLLKLFSLTVTYNILFLAALSSSAFSLYWTACSLTRCRSASFVAGLAFGFSPFFMAHGLGHMNLISAEFIAPFALFFYAALTASSFCRGILYSLYAGGMLALAGYCDWYHFVFCLTLLACLLVVFVWGKSVPTWRRYFGLAILSLVTGAILLTPILAPALHERAIAGSNYMNTAAPEVEGYHGDIADYLPFSLPAALNESPVKPSNYVERGIAPGLVMLILAVVGICVARRKMYPWLWVILAGLILMSGRTLIISGHNAFPQWLLLALGGAPGSGFDVPWNNQGLVSLALHMAGDPSAIATTCGSITMPFTWLPQLLPPLKAFKVPSRFGLLVVFGIAIFAACGLAYLQERWSSKIPPKVLSLVCAALVLLGYSSIPYPTHSTKIPLFYQWIARQKGNFALVEAPLRDSSAYQWYQTTHHKPIFAAVVSREPPNATHFIENNALLHFLSNDFAETDWQKEIKVLSQGRKLSKSLQQLRSVHARYIVVHKMWMNPVAQSDLDKLLRQAGLPVMWNDKQLKVYRL